MPPEEELRPGTINLNILPEKYREPEPPISERATLLLAVASGLLVVLLFLTFMRFNSRVEDLRGELQSLNQQIEETGGVPQEVRQLQNSLEQLNNQISSLETQYQGVTRGRDWPAIFDTIYDLTPPEVNVETVERVQEGIDQLAVSGRAERSGAVDVYLQDLQGSLFFTSASLQSLEPLVEGEETPTPVITGTAVLTPTITPTFTPTPVDPRDAYDRPEPDDFSPRPIVVGTSQRRNFHPEFDVDKAQFLAKDGRRYIVSTDIITPALGVDTVLRVDVGGSVYSNDDESAGDLSSEVEFENTSGADQEAIITITNRGAFGRNTFYNLNVSEGFIAGDDFEEDDVTPKPIGLNAPQGHNFYPEGDVDKVQFTVKAGQWYSVTTSSLALGVDTSISVAVGGRVFANDDRSPDDISSSLQFRAGADGVAFVTIRNLGIFGSDKTYTIGVGQFQPAQTPTPTPTPDLRDRFENDDFEPAPIGIGEVQVRNFDPRGDVDRAKFIVKAGRVYSVTTSIPSAPPYLIDTRLEVRFGNKVVRNDDVAPGKLESVVSFQASRDGLAFVTVDNLGQFGVPEGDPQEYELRVVELPPPPTPTPTGTPTSTPGPPSPTPVPSPTPCGGRDDVLEPDDTIPVDVILGQPQDRTFCLDGDVDRAQFLAKNGRRYRIFTSGLSPAVDTVLEADVGGTIYSNDDVLSGPEPRSSFVGFVVNTGFDVTAKVKVENRGQYGPNQDYTLVVEESGPADQFEVDDVVPKPIAFNQAQNHNFNPDGDQDKVQFQAKADRWYLVFTSDLAFGVDTHLQVDVAGTTYQNDDRRPGVKFSRILFRSPLDTGAVVTITNRGEYGPEKSYNVTVVELPFNADQYEYDDVTPMSIAQPAPGGGPVVQTHTFYPGGTVEDIDTGEDIDRLTFDALGGRRYVVRTENTSDVPLVDTFLEVTVGGTPLPPHDDISTVPPINRDSRVEFTTSSPARVEITVRNVKSGVFASNATYDVAVEDLGAAPTVRAPAASAHLARLMMPSSLAGSARRPGLLPDGVVPPSLQDDVPVRFVIILQLRPLEGGGGEEEATAGQ